MENISFRAWDKDHKYMEYTDKNLIVSFGDNGNVDATDLSNIYLTCNGMQNFELMQSTGLKDKNGTEIYEGDIVELKYPYDKRIKTKGSIVWDRYKSCFGISMKETTERYELYRVTAENYLSVIGNVFENKSLLNEE